MDATKIRQKWALYTSMYCGTPAIQASLFSFPYSLSPFPYSLIPKEMLLEIYIGELQENGRQRTIFPYAPIKNRIFPNLAFKMGAGE